MDYKDSHTDIIITADYSRSALWLLFLFSIFFVFAGLWIVLDAASSYDMLMGGLSAFCFGAASIALGIKLKTK